MKSIVLQYLVVFGAVSALLGCASGNSKPEAAKVDSDPAASARIRLFGNNGTGVVFYRNQSCVPQNRQGGERVSGGMGQSFKALVQVDQTESIGMPPSQRSTRRRDGILAREFSKEYHVKAGEPITVTMGFTGTPQMVTMNGVTRSGRSESCSVPGGTFVPEAGKDYDVYLDIRRSEGICLATVEAIDAAGGSVPAQVRPATVCM